MENIQDIVDHIVATVERHRISPGNYCRWLWQNEKGDRELGSNPYGCADAANLLYTVGHFPADPEERQHWIQTLQNFQQPETGLFYETTHHTFHTTAHCLGALELFDAKPLYPLTAMHRYLPEGKIEEFLENLDWRNDPWDQSHQGAGVYAALVLAEEADLSWCNRYFGWLWDNADPNTGMWRKGEPEQASPRGILAHMAGTFHYLFNHEYAHMPLRYPDKLIDKCIEMYDVRHVSTAFGKKLGFSEVDWVYCLSRASRQTPYRREDVKDRLSKFCKEYLQYWRSLDWEKDDEPNDLHSLFGASCALAELQSALPGELLTEKPLKLVLDRRPFI